MIKKTAESLGCWLAIAILPRPNLFEQADHILDVFAMLASEHVAFHGDEVRGKRETLCAPVFRSFFFETRVRFRSGMHLVTGGTTKWIVNLESDQRLMNGVDEQMTPRLRSSKTARKAAFALGMMVTMACGGAHAGNVTGIVAFGDSLSDVGNFYAATNGASPPSSLHYDNGRFSNGLNWVEYLAKDLGVAAPTASTSGGTDFAYGGAMTGDGTTVSTFLTGTATVPNIGTQIATYLTSNTPTASQLFTIWGGANDFLNGGQTNPFVPAENIAAEIATLAVAGAKQFVVPNLPPLGSLPITNTYPPAVSQALNLLTQAFNTILQGEMTGLEQALGIQITVVDVYGLTENVFSDPEQYGFTNVTTDAVQDNGGTNAEGYLFWDIVHPTSAADALIAASAVPEPSSVVLMGIALGGLVFGARMRRRGRRFRRASS
jgi:phospholipase/lecithinase/hemolysin